MLLDSCQTGFGSKCLDALPNEPSLSPAPESAQRHPGGAEGEGSWGEGMCDLDRSRKYVALNGGDRLPAGIQTPPRRPPEGVFPGEEKDNKGLRSA